MWIYNGFQTQSDFYNKYILIKKTFQVEIWKIFGFVNVFFSFCFSIPCISQPKKGNFRELKSKQFPRRACPQMPLEVCAHLGNQSVFILDLCLNIELDFAHSFLRLVPLQLDS